MKLWSRCKSSWVSGFMRWGLKNNNNKKVDIVVMKLEAKEIYGPIIQGYPLSWYRLAHTFQKAIRCRKMFKLQEKQILEMKQLWKNFKNTCSGLSTMNIHRKDWCWSSNTLATWCRESTLWKRPWCWERLRAGKEGDDRGWDGWMASPT